MCRSTESPWTRLRHITADGGDDSESDESESDDDEHAEGFGDVGAAPAAHVWQGGAGEGAPAFPFLTDAQEIVAGAVRHAQCADDCLVLDQQEAAAAAAAGDD